MNYYSIENYHAIKNYTENLNFQKFYKYIKIKNDGL